MKMRTILSLLQPLVASWRPHHDYHVYPHTGAPSAWLATRTTCMPLNSELSDCAFQLTPILDSQRTKRLYLRYRLTTVGEYTWELKYCLEYDCAMTAFE